ncbi:hypothetical protein SAMN05421839_10618 [Halolactibacillus halophilus]|uniref:HNH endonuclease n=1 Tax=Halolactibacillus halophilus TaxID=306540 RepID=A0A1I5MP04_9BACI|nr:HNH endonuclease [Halolactibacillus halophilus]GEM02510.1 hypothetical protein HHA03_20420 [Halolactibacillus halophilus]SFP10686.1 hypothetical protein SAMN05421839_10618 [Halolactibacillus halophilus]
MATKQTNPFYKTKRWRRKRENILKQRDYLCAESRQYGNNRQAEMIHHIYPLEDYPELAYEDWNLLPLTNATHNTFHDRNTNEVIGRGLYWQSKRKKEFDRFYEERKLKGGDRHG